MRNLIIAAFLPLAFTQVAYAGGPGDSPLGVSTAPIDATVLASTKMKMKNGVVVTDVNPNSIATDVGLKKDDIIHEVNGQDIINEQQLSAIIKSMKDGDRLTFVVTHNNKTWTLRGVVQHHTEQASIQ